jgi:superfamily II DNA/RNA helicase
MLDMGFIPDVERIVSLLPKIRQTLFFSATMDKGIRKLADAFLMNPKEISVAPPASTADTVEQHIVHTTIREKRDVLRSLIESEEVANALIFCNRKRDCGVVHRSLVRHGYDAVVLHGDMSQPARTETLAKFKAGEARLLVCSDVAARGLDIAGLSHVFNFDVPTNAEDYVHRIGRTGRAGRGGRSFTIATSEDGKYVQAISKLINKSIEVVEVAGLSSKASQNSANPETASGRASDEQEGKRRAPTKRARGARGRAKAEQETQSPVDPTEQPQPDIAAADEQPRQRPRRQSREAREPREDGQSGGSGRRSRGERVYPGEKVPPPVPANAPTKGMGDHVPAFMMRPARSSVA